MKTKKSDSLELTSSIPPPQNFLSNRSGRLALTVCKNPSQLKSESNKQTPASAPLFPLVLGWLSLGLALALAHLQATQAASFSANKSTVGVAGSAVNNNQNGEWMNCLVGPAPAIPDMQ